MSIIIWKVLTSSVVVKKHKKCHIYVYVFGQAKAVLLLVSKLQCSVSIRAVVRPHQDSELPVHASRLFKTASWNQILAFMISAEKQDESENVLFKWDTIPPGGYLIAAGIVWPHKWDVRVLQSMLVLMFQISVRILSVCVWSRSAKIKFQSE